jgi:hypothetical protein
VEDLKCLELEDLAIAVVDLAVQVDVVLEAGIVRVAKAV